MDILKSGRSAMRHASERQSTLDRIKGYLPEDGKTKKTLVTVGALALAAGVFIAKSGCEYGTVDDSSNADTGVQQRVDTNEQPNDLLQPPAETDQSTELNIVDGAFYNRPRCQHTLAQNPGACRVPNYIINPHAVPVNPNDLTQAEINSEQPTSA